MFGSKQCKHQQCAAHHHIAVIEAVFPVNTTLSPSQANIGNNLVIYINKVLADVSLDCMYRHTMNEKWALRKSLQISKYFLMDILIQLLVVCAVGLHLRLVWWTSDHLLRLVLHRFLTLGWLLIFCLQQTLNLSLHDGNVQQGFITPLIYCQDWRIPWQPQQYHAQEEADTRGLTWITHLISIVRLQALSFETL